MTVRRKLWLGLSIAAFPFSLAIGWGWNRSCESLYVAVASISIPVRILEDRAANDGAPVSVDESLLSPEIAAAAADLLHERGIRLPSAALLDSEIDYLIDHLEVAHELSDDRVDVELRYQTTEEKQGVAVLAAVVDATLQSLHPVSPEQTDQIVPEIEHEREQLAQAVERQQSQIAGWQAQLAGLLQDTPQAAATPEEVAALTSACEEARGRRIEAEDQLALACREIRSGAAIEQIVALLSDESDKDAQQALVATLRLHDELRQLETAWRSAGAVYGRNHPRMTGLKQQLDDMRQRLAAQEVQVSGPSSFRASAEVGKEGAASPPPSAAWLLNSLKERCQRLTRAEQELHERLSATIAKREERTRLEAQLAETAPELAFLEKEQDRVRQELASVRQLEEGRRIRVTESPLLRSEPILPPLEQHLLWAGIPGLLVSVMALRGFNRASALRVVADRYRGELFPHDQSPSRKEENLACLRRLKPHLV